MIAAPRKPPNPLFKLGRVVGTPRALKALKNARQAPSDFLSLHVAGNWGVVCPEDAATNERALARGASLHSVYELNDGSRIWIITEADREHTTILLPDEY